jgi:hypothetical protein
VFLPENYAMQEGLKVDDVHVLRKSRRIISVVGCVVVPKAGVNLLIFFKSHLFFWG